MKMSIIMWDWDGTLVDTMPAHADLAAGCIEKHFGMVFQSAREQYMNTTGIPFDHQLRLIFSQAEEDDILACAEEYHREKINYVYENPKDFPETQEVIKKLQGMGVYQVISSSTEEGIINKWAQQRGVQMDILGRESGAKKDHIARIRKSFPTEKIIFVSDSYGDMDLPAEITLGVDVPQNKEKLFYKSGAKNVSLQPINIKWLENVLIMV